MTRSLAATTVAAALLAGCLAGGEHCETQGAFQITWREAGLYEHFSERSSNATINVSRDPPDGFTLSNKTLDERYGPGNYRVNVVVWRGAATLNDHAFEQEPALTPPGNVHAQWSSTISNETARAFVRDFVKNVTRLAPAEADRVADAFMANKTEAGMYLTEDPAKGGKPIHTYEAHVDVRRWVRIQELWDETHARGDADPPFDYNATRVPPWEFGLDIAYVMIQESGAANRPRTSPGVDIDGWTWSVAADSGTTFASGNAQDEVELRQQLEQIRHMAGLGPAPKGTVASPSDVCWHAD